MFSLNCSGLPIPQIHETEATTITSFLSDNKDDVEQVDIIQGYDSQKGDYFGYGVSIDGDKIGVGAFREDSTKENAGSAYFFIKDTNEEE